ncbi:MAG: hypothetical protein Q7K57_60780, partial [Burkholderiaceae bacterium]|nr:hypothetical protein [Burkholderiaceae bacterium]
FVCVGASLNGVANRLITALFHWAVADVIPIANVRVRIHDVSKKNWGTAGVVRKTRGGDSLKVYRAVAPVILA